MRKINLTILSGCLMLAFLVAFTACKNKENPEPNPDPNNNNNNHHANEATITIASPAANAVYNQGDTVKITGTATGTESLHGWEIFLRNTTFGDSIIYNTSDHVHDTLVSFSGSWVNNVSMESDIELEVCVGLNHDGDKNCQTVSFKAKP